jgi:Fatty acid/phospholipid biosynthesis enzyme
MVKKINIAIDAMGGEDAPKKNIEGLDIFLKKNKRNDDFIIHLFGDKKILDKYISDFNISDKRLEIIHTEAVVSDEETPLTAIKSSKNTSMWNSIKSQIDGKADISLSAGNTGVLLVISRYDFEIL